MAKLKRGPLSKAETYYIDGHFAEMEVAEIASDLNRAISLVQNYIKKNHKASKNPMAAGQHFIRQSGVTIMSENAATIADSHRKGRPAPSEKCTTRITRDE